MIKYPEHFPHLTEKFSEENIAKMSPRKKEIALAHIKK